ncbi:MAG: hypothetical protein GY730_11505 [bacterium]|nr:hypothetical protein [bacterium]
MKKNICIVAFFFCFIIGNENIFSADRKPSLNNSLAAGFTPFSYKERLFLGYTYNVQLLIQNHCFNVRYLTGRSMSLSFHPSSVPKIKYSQLNISCNIYNVKIDLFRLDYDIDLGVSLVEETFRGKSIKYLGVPFEIKSKWNISDEIQLNSGVFINTNFIRWAVGYIAEIEIKF